MRVLLLILVGFSVISGSSTLAIAQKAPKFSELGQEKKQRVSALLAQAQAKERATQYPAAIALYESVYEQFAHPKILWSIANCYDKQFTANNKETNARQSALKYYRRYQSTGSNAELLSQTKTRINALTNNADQKTLGQSKAFFDEPEEETIIRVGVFGQLSQTSSYSIGLLTSINVIAGFNIEPRLYYESRSIDAPGPNNTIDQFSLGYLQVGVLANYDWYFVKHSFVHIGLGPNLGMLINDKTPNNVISERNALLLGVSGFIGLGVDYKDILASISAEFEESISSISSGFGSNFGDTFFTIKVMYKF